MDKIMTDMKNMRRIQTLKILHFFGIQVTIVSIGLWLEHYYTNAPRSPFLRASFAFFGGVTCYILKTVLKSGKLPILDPYIGQLATVMFFLLINEESIFLFPYEFRTSPIMLIYMCLDDHFSTMIGTSAYQHTVQRSALWVFYFFRNLIHYGKLPAEIFFFITCVLLLQRETSLIKENYIASIINQASEMQHILQETIDKIHNTVLIYDRAKEQFVMCNIKTISYLPEKQRNLPPNALLEAVLKAFQQSKIKLVQNTMGQDQSEGSGDNLSTKVKESPMIGIKQLWDYIVKAHEYIGEEFLFKTTQDPKYYFSVNSSIINNSSQTIIFCTDVTNMMRFEKQQQRMRATFFSSVAHELRTPLNSILPIVKMVLQLLAKGHVDTVQKDRIANLLKIVMNSSVHLQNVIEDALDVSRIENNKFALFIEEFNIRDVVAQVCDVMKFQFTQKGLEFKCEIAQDVPVLVNSDQKRYKQVLFNLMGNAQKFTFQGAISVKIDYDIITRVLKTTVIDTGIGMSQEELKKLFRFFGTLQKSKNINRNGMGLGLTISKMIVRQLGGEITVQSTQQVGSEFSFSIPLPQPSHNVEKEARSEGTVTKMLLTPQKSMTISPKRRLSKFAPLKAKKTVFVEERENKKHDIREFTDKGLTTDLDMTLISCSQIAPNQTNADENAITVSGTYLDTDIQGPMGKQYFQKYVNSGLQGTNKLVMDSLSKEQEPPNYFSQEETKERKWKVLIVDDSAYNLFVLEEVLKEVDASLEVQTALNGQICLSKFDGQDIIFMDLQMPVLDGYQTVVRLNEKHQKGEISLKNTSIIALSAISESQFKQSLAHYKNCEFHSFSKLQFFAFKQKNFLCICFFLQLILFQWKSQ
ncbi:hypothetical protein FGO68_gene9792 [Halteria grandinella]|uniref:Multi-sensor hybrid histidine kinase n=1 Tax=Halteria grandinella TaxID=5974 RepID=A0A8J8NFY5_HALGN|nr:hypothetical protein FGO68_gene9792 [Halteria grandinella]